MGKLTSDVFSPSCCDGGGSSDSGQSAQPCGCDAGAGWQCAYHTQLELYLVDELKEMGDDTLEKLRRLIEERKRDE